MKRFSSSSLVGASHWLIVGATTLGVVACSYAQEAGAPQPPAQPPVPAEKIPDPLPPETNTSKHTEAETARQTTPAAAQDAGAQAQVAGMAAMTITANNGVTTIVAGGINTYPQGQTPTNDKRAQSEARLREMLGRCGITNPAAQDSVIAYLAADEQGRNAVRDSAKRLVLGVRRSAPPERLKDLLAEYKNSLQNDRLRREKAQVALDAQIGYSLDSRLESVLWLAGVLGDGQVTVNINSLFPRGGPNNQQANQQGGQEGNNNGGTTGYPMPNGFGGPIGGPNGFSPGAGFPGGGNGYGGGPNGYAGGPNMPRGRVLGEANPPRMANLAMQNTPTFGIVVDKGDQDEGEMWVEIRSDAGRSDRYWPQWQGGATGNFATEMVKQLDKTPVGARVRYVFVVRNRPQLLSLDVLGNAVVDNPTKAVPAAKAGQNPETANGPDAPVAPEQQNEPQETPQ